jgi:hypothetical protein
MRKMTKAKIGVGALGAITLTVGLVGQSVAYADYAPGSKDVVGVGSDTVQDIGDFIADGDFLGDTGWNFSGANKIVNFDATADANTRLAYSTDGGAGGINCSPGTGALAGTGNATTKHAETNACTLNPTIVLRAGLSPVQRPNGSGGGKSAWLNDTTTPYKIQYVRASAAYASQAAFVTAFGTGGADAATVGTDPLAMLSTGVAGLNPTHAVALSAAQLKLIYACTTSPAGGAGHTMEWVDVGGSSTNSIIPVLPQLGSGTRSRFLTDIGSPTPGTCVKTAEENDPTYLTTTTSPDDTIEPMSGGRLNLFLGNLGDGTANGVGGYFKDPSCVFKSATPAACVSPANTISVSDTKFWTAGSPSDAQPILNDQRPLYIYFRDSDVNSPTAFEPGSTLNWVRSLFYNPCSGTGHTTGCVTIGGVTYGPGGQPYYATDAGQGLISAAGVDPTGYTVAVPGP